MINKLDSGIYFLIWPNSNIYVGSSTNLNRRLSQHIKDLELGNHHNDRCQNCFNKYGNPNIDVIRVDDPRRLEQYYLDNYYDYLLNLSRRSSGGNTISDFSQAQLEALSEKIKLGLDSKSDLEIQEWKDNLSKSHTGKTLDEEHKSKISASGKEAWKTRPRTFPPEVGRKISATKKAQKLKAHNRDLSEYLVISPDGEEIITQ